MPPGFVHYRFYKAGATLNIPAGFYLFFKNPIFGFSYILGYLFHRYCDNDWDILGTNMSESRAIHELKIIGYLIYGISSVYGAIFMRKHRSFITHFPVFSTIIRLLFVFGIPVFFLYYTRTLIYDVWQVEVFLGFWLGLSMADYIHFCADHLWPEDGKRFLEQEKIRLKKEKQFGKSKRNDVANKQTRRRKRNKKWGGIL